MSFLSFFLSECLLCLFTLEDVSALLAIALPLVIILTVVEGSGESVAPELQIWNSEYMNENQKEKNMVKFSTSPVLEANIPSIRTGSQCYDITSLAYLHGYTLDIAIDNVFFSTYFGYTKHLLLLFCTHWFPFDSIVRHASLSVTPFSQFSLLVTLYTLHLIGYTLCTASLVVTPSTMPLL